MEQQNEVKSVLCGIDVQATKIELALFQAEVLESSGRALLTKASELRQAARPFIRLEIQDDGSISMRAWRGDQIDSSYPPHSLDFVLRELVTVVRELQQPEPLSSRDERAR